MSIFAEGNEYALPNLFVRHANPERCRAATSTTSICTESKTSTCFTMIKQQNLQNCGVLLPPASPGEALAVKPQDSLTNTEERLMCRGMSAKPSLPFAQSFSAKPEPAMVMQLSPFPSLSSKDAISTALQK